MLAVSPLFPGFEWEYPISIGAQEQAMDYMHFDNNFLDNSPSIIQPQTQYDRDCDRDRDRAHHDWRGRSPQSASSVDDLGASILAKKLNHNASERDRRKKINVLYSTLRSLLPNTDHTKKLSIPATISRVLKYIPELQKEMENLIHKKEELLSKISTLQGDAKDGKKPKEDKNTKEKSLSSSISVNKLGEREIVIQISTYEKVPMPEVLLLLENDGLLVMDVSTSQSFGGRTLYNIHLWMEGTTIMKYEEELKEQLLSLIEKHKRVLYF